jgi:hypothetical protein
MKIFIEEGDNVTLENGITGTVEFTNKDYNQVYIENFPYYVWDIREVNGNSFDVDLFTI